MNEEYSFCPFSALFIPKNPLPSLLLRDVVGLAGTAQCVFLILQVPKWQVSLKTRSDRHHPAASESHPAPLATCTFFGQNNKDLLSLSCSQWISFRAPVGAIHFHIWQTESEFYGGELFWDSVRKEVKKKKKWTVCGKDLAGETLRDVLILQIQFQEQNFGLFNTHWDEKLGSFQDIYSNSFPGVSQPHHNSSSAHTRPLSDEIQCCSMTKAGLSSGLLFTETTRVNTHISESSQYDAICAHWFH